jgi:hypothetical protein
MALDYIVVDSSTTTAKFARDLINFTRSLRSAIDQLDAVKAVMDHSNNGVSFTQIETLFGLASGQGQTVYDLVNGTRLALSGSAQNSNALALIDRVGG